MDDYAVWDIDELLSAYSEVPDVADQVRLSFMTLFIFMEKNGLLQCKISDESGNLTKRRIMLSDLSEDGMRMAIGPKNVIHRWLGSKGAQKTPPDIKLLEKGLSEIRSAS